MIQIQRLVVPRPAMRCPERPWFSPRFKHGTAFPDRVRRIKRIILSFGPFEKVKLYEARDFFQMAVARETNLLERLFGPLGNAETVHCDEHYVPLLNHVADGRCLAPNNQADIRTHTRTVATCLKGVIIIFLKPTFQSLPSCSEENDLTSPCRRVQSQ